MYGMSTGVGYGGAAARRCRLLCCTVKAVTDGPDATIVAQYGWYADGPLLDVGFRLVRKAEERVVAKQTAYLLQGHVESPRWTLALTSSFGEGASRR